MDHTVSSKAPPGLALPPRLMTLLLKTAVKVVWVAERMLGWVRGPEPHSLTSHVSLYESPHYWPGKACYRRGLQLDYVA